MEKTRTRFHGLKLRLSLTAGAIAALWLIGDALIGYWGIYNPGRVSRPHSLVENDCNVCHTGAKNASVAFLRPVTNESCSTCHSGAIHHPNQIFNSQAGTQPNCSTCHQEHRGRTISLSQVPDNDCTQCHGDLKVAPTPAAAGFAKTIHSFRSDHPEFQIIREKQKDPTPIKLNHEKHLRPDLPGSDGRKVQMQCSDCHRSDAAGSKFQPIEFERDCESCHSLAFDERIRESAPHEEPKYVEAFVRVAFSKYAGKNPNEWKTDVDFHPAQNLAELKMMLDEAPRNLPEWLEKQVVRSNRMLFEKCQECHVVQNATQTLPVIVKPEIPDQWMTHSRFDHGPHRILRDCTSCHEEAPNSSETSDVLLPSRNVCLECHKPSAAADTCVTCHTYHPRSR